MKKQMFDGLIRTLRIRELVFTTEWDKLTLIATISGIRAITKEPLIMITNQPNFLQCRENGDSLSFDFDVSE